uniref:GOST seven transmembrane domain-containing protein n=1 Tax=Leersia perrieri TaxID=77586 RepID=A0A0D9X1G0_9ORYZ
MPSMNLPLIIIIHAVAAAMIVDASVHEYAGERFAAGVGNGGAFVLHGGSEGIYASSTAESFVRFEKVAFRRSPESDGNRTVTVTAVIFENADRDAVADGAALCRAAAASNTSVWPRLLAAQFLPGSLLATFPDETIPVTRTGMYTLNFILCDAGDGVAAAGNGVAAEGKTIWKNSGGYLPGRMAPLRPFYGFMSLAFAALAAAWLARHAVFFLSSSPAAASPATPSMLMLQCVATAAVAIGMVEVTTWVAGFAVAYFAAAEALDVGENVGIISDHSPARRIFLLIPVAVLNTVFIYWIFSSLSRTITKLKARRMTAKLEMYRKFANYLIITVALSLGWITFEVHFKLTDEHNERWRVAWVIPAVWQLISFGILCSICLLWAPSQNSMRFAYSAEDCEEGTEHHDDDDDDDVEDTQPLIRPGPLSYVDNWACYVTQDAKIILRTDSGVYAKASEEYKRV